jgi:curved DNA-binding protein CbpA
MGLADHYRVLGLRSGAAFEDIKAAYRQLARRYHPDVNSGDQQAKEKFIQVTQAYQALADVLAPEGDSAAQPAAVSSEPATAQPAPRVQVNPQLSAAEQQLKQALYEQLQQLLQAMRWPRAIALVEGLAQRFPADIEVRQWQAITYQRWGRGLIQQQNWDKAERYLKKALKTDPHNKSLWREVTQDLQQLQQARDQVPLP